MATSKHKAEKGMRHWWMQRASAMILVPLTLWFVVAMLNHVGDSHREAVAWISHPVVAIAISVYLVVLFLHAGLGVQVILEDYVSSRIGLRIVLWLLRLVILFACGVAVYSVIQIAIPTLSLPPLHF